VQHLEELTRLWHFILQLQLHDDMRDSITWKPTSLGSYSYAYAYKAQFALDNWHSNE
jgi:hypothetical protein